MNRKEHRQWLVRLAAEDAGRRAHAEPELYRKEALLRSAQAKLDASRHAVSELEAILDEARRDEGGADAPPSGAATEP